jgi:ribonucleoside-diphosphate reductase alpha chain
MKVKFSNTRFVDAQILGPKGEVVFEKKNFEIPENWSDRAAMIMASKYATNQENSAIDIIYRVVNQISEWGTDQGYFGPSQQQTYTEMLTFKDALADILLNQRAAFNSPVWFNCGVPENNDQMSACQPGWAKINTSKGLLTIEEIVNKNLIGLKLPDDRKILAVKNNGTKEVLRIHTSSGLYIDVTPDHRVYKANGWIKAYKPGRQDRCFVEAQNLKAGDMLLWESTKEQSDKTEDHDSLDSAEAYLAGWLQADGFVGQYDNTPLILEGIAINKDELVALRYNFSRVFPDTHKKESNCTTPQGTEYHRIRLYGEDAREFVSRWNLLPRRTEMEVPEFLFSTEDLHIVAQYLRAWFQADGYCNINKSGSVEVGIGVISPKIIEGIQLLLQRFGIFSRRYIKKENRIDRFDLHCLSIHKLSECEKFASEIGFIGSKKQEKLETGNLKNKKGKRIDKYTRVTISNIESLGEHTVYDIQTNTEDYLTNGIRVHNCFIFPVEDNMEDILAHTTREGLVFRAGSGAGVNVSKLRAKGEALSNKGQASGPISFMKTWDANAGSIKSGGKNRRSAKMVCMDADHPDIMEFIECKYHEERKAKMLIDAGCDPEEAYSTVWFQNANHSIRVSDEFMNAANDKEAYWNLINRGDSKLISGKGLAYKILRRTAEIAWETGDPGIQFDDRMNLDNPVPLSDRIHSTNPCAEFSAIDNSSCNLASLNLVKYMTEDDIFFDAISFKKDIEILITAMDILVDAADYPTPEVRETTVKTRPLGLGFSNLGALLMLSGIPYDSVEARDRAAYITKLMTTYAYEQSIKLAEKMGSFEYFEENKEVNINIINRLTENNDLAEECRIKGLRNSQVTLLAPTGTISFMMDCDTTGIEPIFALKSYKTLVGGGTISIIPDCIEKAVNNLNKNGAKVWNAETAIDLIIPYLDPYDKKIFATANEISWRAHIDMMAVCQKHLNGAISKTINMASNATVEDVMEAYTYAWEKGIKALAIYRDGSKMIQPLNVDKEDTEEDYEYEEEDNEPKWQAVRRKLPDTRDSITHKFNIGGFEGYITVGMYNDGTPGEAFINMQKQGSTINGLMDTFATVLSLALQYGVPLDKLAEKLINTRFDPAGFTGNQEIPMAKSIMDYIFRWMQIEFCNDAIVEYDDQALPSIIPQGDTETLKIDASGPLCQECGHPTIMEGRCHKCLNCGITSGCS